MDVEECEAIARMELAALDVGEPAARSFERARRDVSRDDRIRHARQTAMPEVNVSTADFGSRSTQERTARR
jgi:hypothetical protein